MGSLIITQQVMERGLTARRIVRERRTVGVLYRLLRSKLGLTQEAMGAQLGCSRYAIIQREKTKRVYSLEELTALYQLSGMTATEWWSMIEDIAKPL